MPYVHKIAAARYDDDDAPRVSADAAENVLVASPSTGVNQSYHLRSSGIAHPGGVADDEPAPVGVGVRPAPSPPHGNARSHSNRDD